MAETPSSMMELKTKAPYFKLLDTVSDKEISLNETQGDLATLILFICNHCPFVKHINSELALLAKDYVSRGINLVAISSNDADNYPEDSPELMKLNAEEQGFIFPYLYDQTQEVAKLYDARCTPDFFLFDKSLELVYRGQLDDSRPGNDLPVTAKDIRQVFDALLKGNKISEIQKPSIGCNIKWKGK